MVVEVATLEELEKYTNPDTESVVLFGATWCVPCKKFRPHFDKAAESFDFPFVVVYIDTLVGTTEAEVAAKYGVQSVPTARYHDSTSFSDVSTRQGALGFTREVSEKRN